MMVGRLPARLLVAWTPVLLGAAPAVAARFTIAPGAGSEVRFASKAPVESFSGRTDRVSGWVDCDPAALGDSVTIEVTVDLASLDTGIALRNQHMRENHLETDRYPQAVFRGGRLSGGPSRLVPGETATLELAGELELHGVRRPLRLPVQVTLSDAPGGSRLRIEARFPVALAAHEIRRPQFLMLKLSDVQQVTLKLVADGPPGGDE